MSVRGAEAGATEFLRILVGNTIQRRAVNKVIFADGRTLCGR
jgi:hypothetical protein